VFQTVIVKWLHWEVEYFSRTAVPCLLRFIQLRNLVCRRFIVSFLTYNGHCAFMTKLSRSVSFFFSLLIQARIHQNIPNARDQNAAAGARSFLFSWTTVCVHKEDSGFSLAFSRCEIFSLCLKDFEGCLHHRSSASQRPFLFLFQSALRTTAWDTSRAHRRETVFFPSVCISSTSSLSRGDVSKGPAYLKNPIPF